MKKLSLILNIIILSSATCYGMESTLSANVNLDILPKDVIIAIGYLLDAHDIDTLRCVNKACQQKTLSLEEIDDNFICAIPKAIEEDDTALLLRWKRYGARTRKIFQNLLEANKKDCARLIYSECGLVANNELELAAKYGNTENTKLLITDYYADDTSRALTPAVAYGFKDLAIMLIQKYGASLSFAHKKAAKDGNTNLFKLFVELYLDPNMTEKLTVEPFFEAAAGCNHSDLENCGHKDIITLLISEYRWRNIDGTIFKASSPCKEGIIKWLITHYKSCLLYTSPSPRD